MTFFEVGTIESDLVRFVMANSVFVPIEKWPELNSSSPRFEPYLIRPSSAPPPPIYSGHIPLSFASTYPDIPLYFSENFFHPRCEGAHVFIVFPRFRRVPPNGSRKRFRGTPSSLFQCSLSIFPRRRDVYPNLDLNMERYFRVEVYTDPRVRYSI